MRKPGLIGGLGPESTIHYYKGILSGVQQKLGCDNFPALTIENVDLKRVVEDCKYKRFDDLANYLLKAIHNLARAGADFVAIASNTPHIIFDRLQEKSPVRIISIVDSTCQEAIKRGYKRTALLGTVFTMKNDFYVKPFGQKGIDVVIPNEEEISYVNDRIYDELAIGIIKEDTRRGLLKIIKRLKEEEGIDSVVLGCTELPLILNDEISPVPCLDTMQIHINDIVGLIVDS